MTKKITAKSELPTLVSTSAQYRKYMNNIEVFYNWETKIATVQWEDYLADYDFTDAEGIENEIRFISQFLAGDGSFSSEAYDTWFENQKKSLA